MQVEYAAFGEGLRDPFYCSECNNDPMLYVDTKTVRCNRCGFEYTFANATVVPGSLACITIRR